MQHKLFRNIATADLLPIDVPLFPAEPLIRYVVAWLPADIRQCQQQELSLADLARRHARLLEDEADRIQAITDAGTAAEAQLDLLMLLGAYLPTKQQAYTIAPPLLLTLLDSNAAQHRLPRRMTYELIVDVNTTAWLRSGHARLFSDESVALIERDFYIGHYFAEQHIRSAYESLRNALRQPSLAAETDALRAVVASLEQFTEYMAVYSRLPAAEYTYFRQFLKPYPDGTKNASGAFMPTPQLFEMLLHQPGYAQAEFLAGNMQYIPRWAHGPLTEQAARAAAGRTLEAALLQDTSQLPAEVRTLAGAIVEQFIKFKLTHIQVASSKIPEAFPAPPTVDREALRGFCPFLQATRDGTGAQQGTGGFAPQDFLGDGVRRLLDLQERLRAA